MKHIGYIGLGKMGANMVDHLLEIGYDVTIFDKNPDALERARQNGAEVADSVAELTDALGDKTLIWVMVPHTVVDDVLKDLKPHLQEGDIVVDGGNSPYQKSMRRAEELDQLGVTFLDVGVSGGPSGARNGACMMVGGDKETYEDLETLFTDLTTDDGHAHVGKSGAGHFVKMVHNGIEYGMMQAIAEGFDVMASKEEFDLDLAQVADIYNHGSVIESRLIGWVKKAFEKFGPDLEDVSDVAIGTGEGKWTVEEAKELGVSTDVIEHAWQARKDSESEPNYQAQIIMALRNQFGGHDIDIKLEH
jgi:6-phosphogluconate dehydrogenase